MDSSKQSQGHSQPLLRVTRSFLMAMITSVTLFGSHAAGDLAIQRNAIAEGAAVDLHQADGAFDTFDNSSNYFMRVRNDSPAGAVRRAAFEFDLTGLGGPVESASLNLSAGSRGGVPVVRTYGYASNGLIALTDFSISGKTLVHEHTMSGDFSQSTLAFRDIDVTAFVQDAIDNGLTSVGFVSDAVNGETSFRRTRSDRIDGPRLFLTIAIPEPGSASILLMSVTAFILRRRA